MDIEIKNIPLYKIIPSLVTIIALCLGVSAIRYALDGKFVISAALILFAGVMDGLDGRLARLLSSESEFGAQLDSLSDMISFGVSPAITVYLWLLSDIPYKGVGWGVAMFYIACTALRLARFNVSNVASATHKDSTIAKKFFAGIPAPAAAFLSITPMIMTFELLDSKPSPWLFSVYILTLGLMMVSTIPTFSGKDLEIKHDHVSISLLFFGFFIVTMMLEPWILLPVLSLAYSLSIPFSIYQYRKIVRNLRHDT